MPTELFPDLSVLVENGTSFDSESFEQHIRLLALDGYARTASPDTELSRFIKPDNTLFVRRLNTQKQPLLQYGPNSWLATPADAPFIPAVFLPFLVALFAEPRSLAHLIAAQVTQVSILYCGDDGEITLPTSYSSGHCELLLIIVKENVHVTLYDSVVPSPLELKQEMVCARSILALVEPHAQVNVLSDHVVSKQDRVMNHDCWHVGKAARVSIQEVVLSGYQSWLTKEFKLEEDAHLEYAWLAALKGNEQTALSTTQEHTGVKSSSNVLVKTALSENARSFYRGTIRIKETARHSQANQQQKALMISSSARTCAIPSLEVATHEVQCRHGSAAGKFNDTEVWYLRSRGFTLIQAQRLLIEGFFKGDFVRDTPLMKQLPDNVIFRDS